MLAESLLSFVFHLSVLLLRLLLFLNDLEEGVSLGLGLLSHHDFSLQELLLAGHLKLLGLTQFLLMVSNLLGTSSTLSLLESSLGSQGVDLGLSVGGLLLQFSKTSDFELLLFLDAALFGELGLDSGVSFSVVSNDLEVLLTLASHLLMLGGEGSLVGNLDLGDHLLVSAALLLSKLEVSLLHGLDLSHHLLLLLLEKLALLDSLSFTLLDLVDNDSSTTSLSFMVHLLALLGSLEALETLNLHHEVEAFLLLNPLLLKSLVLLELLVSDCNDFRVEHHLVHMLDIVMFFIELLLSFRKQAVIIFLLFSLEFVRWQFLSSFFVHSHHSLFACLGISHLLVALLSQNLLVGLFDLLGLNLGGSLDAVQFLLSQNGSFPSGSLLSFSSQSSQLVVSDNCDVSGTNTSAFVC